MAKDENQNGKRTQPISAVEQVRRILAGDDGKQRNGIRIRKTAFRKIMEGELDYFDDVHTTYLTLVCCEGQFGWLESRRPYVSRLEDCITESDAEWILQHGVFWEAAGEV